MNTADRPVLWLGNKTTTTPPNDYAHRVPFSFAQRDTLGILPTAVGGAFTIPAEGEGFYLAEVSGRFLPADGSYRQVALLVNGDFRLTSTWEQPIDPTRKVETPLAAGVVYLEEGDVVKVCVSHNAGGSIPVLGRFKLTGV